MKGKILYSILSSCSNGFVFEGFLSFGITTTTITVLAKDFVVE